MIKLKYPSDIFVSQTSKRTFSMSAYLVRRAPEDDSPMKVFDDNFSRIVFTIISNGEGSVRANVKPGEFTGIVERSRVALAMQMEQDCKPAASSGTSGMDTSSLAFTQRFAYGEFKGKSPVDVLVENPGQKGKDILNSQYAWLMARIAQYPANHKMIDAICEAAKLDLSKLSENVATSGLKPAVIYQSGSRPLFRKKREDGFSPVHECDVIWDFSKKYPVGVSVRTYWAPVVQNNDGTLNVLASKKVEEKRYDFHMVPDQWLEAVRKAEAVLGTFERMNLPSAIKMAEDAEKANAEEAKANGNMAGGYQQ